MLKRIFEMLKKGPRAVEYGATFFKEGWFENWELMKPVLMELIRTGGWRRVLDFGCGPGVMIDYMNGLGYDYVGCDYSGAARSLYLERFGKYPERYAKTLDEVDWRRFDLFLAFDVFEHMTDREILALLERAKTPFYLLNISRARHIPGHVNIKKDRGWLKLFKKAGLEYEEALTGKLRQRYLELRPGGEDMWHKNVFVLSRPGLRVKKPRD